MQIQIPTADLKAALSAGVTQMLSTETQLGATAQAQVQALIDSIYPLLTAETQASLTAANPAVPAAYLDVLQGIVTAKIAELGLTALASQRQAIATALASGVKMLGLLLKAVVLA